MRPYKREKFTTMVMVTAFGLSALSFSNTALAASVGKMHDIGPSKTTFVEGSTGSESQKTRKKHSVKKAKSVKKHLNKVDVGAQKKTEGVTTVTQ